MSGYADKVKADIARWSREGLVGQELASRLSEDIERVHGRGIGFGHIIAIMAALLFAAAVLILVAANWEAIPRLGRVGTLFALIAGGYLGGAFLHLRGHAAFGDAAWLVAAAALGGSIALIGQMYHMSGDEAQAILVWCAGTALAAAVLRSATLTVAAVGLAIAWLVYPVASFNVALDHRFIAVLAVLWGLAVWTRSIVARNLILLALVLYAVMLFVDTEQAFVPVLLAAVSAALFLAAVLQGELVERLTGLGPSLAVTALLGFLTAMFALQVEYMDEAHFAWVAAVTIAAIAGALVLGGRLSRGLRWLAYIGFAVQIATVYGAMVGTMLGTAGFFLLAAAGLALLAFVIIRVERRIAKPVAAGGEA